MKRYITMLAAIAALPIIGTPALAATNGTLGATSQGSIGLTVNVPSRAMISGLTDIVFNNADPGSSAAMSQDVCVWSNTKLHQYTVQASGSGTGGAFTVADQTTTTAAPQAYTVAWASSAGQTTGTALTAGGALTGLTSGATSPGCTTGTKSASMIVAVPATSLQAMIANDSYTGTLTLLVSPQ